MRPAALTVLSDVRQQVLTRQTTMRTSFRLSGCTARGTLSRTDGSQVSPQKGEETEPDRQAAAPRACRHLRRA